MENNNLEIPCTRFVFDPSSGKHEDETGMAADQKTNGKFIRGPIPFNWVQAANALPGKAGPVGFALWFLKGVKKSDTFAVTAQIELLAGCTRQALSRALLNLQSANLIKLKHRSGARHVVTILLMKIENHDPAIANSTDGNLPPARVQIGS